MSVFARVTLPLAGLNFVNQASRAVVATVSPLLALEFALSASELGILAAVFFAAYGLVQLPVGMALDRFGPRAVQMVLALWAAVGLGMCALAPDPFWLGAGRELPPPKMLDKKPPPALAAGAPFWALAACSSACRRWTCWVSCLFCSSRLFSAASCTRIAWVMK